MPAPPPSRNPREGSKSRAASSGQKRSRLKLRRVRASISLRFRPHTQARWQREGKRPQKQWDSSPFIRFIILSLHLFTLFCASITLLLYLCTFHPLCTSFTLSVHLFTLLCTSITLFVYLLPSLYVFRPICASFHSFCASLTLFVYLSPSLYVFHPFCVSFTLFVYLSPSLYVFHPLCASFFINNKCKWPILTLLFSTHF